MKKFQLTSFLFSLVLLLLSCSSDSENPTPEPDTIAPTVSFTINGFSSGSGPIVVSDQIEININAQDAGGIAKVEAFIDNQKVGEDTTTPFNIVVDLSGYASKDLSAKSQNYTLRVVATDTSGNTSSQEQPITIVSETPLITINLPDGYINPDIIEFYIFASTMEGELLGVKKVDSNSSSVVIGTVKDVPENEKFMLTFAKLNPYGAKFSTIANLTSELLPEINLDQDKRFELQIENQLFQSTGFDANSGDILYIVGKYYIGNIDFQNNNVVQIDRYECVNCDYVASDHLYFSLRNADNPYKYLITDWEIDENFVLSPDDFTNQGLGERSVQIINEISQPINNIYFSLFGYFDESDFQNNYYHLIDSKGSGSLINDNLHYIFNDSFEKYSFEITLNGYYSYRNGIPTSTITPLDWILDYTITGRSLMINKNTTEDILGKVILGSQTVDENYIPYSWDLIFDSQNTNELNIPELPEEIKSWDFYEAFSTQPLHVGQVEIKRYENIIGFEDYILTVIANNKKATLISNKIESVFKNNDNNVHRTLDDWLID